MPEHLHIREYVKSGKVIGLINLLLLLDMKTFFNIKPFKPFFFFNLDLFVWIEKTMQQADWLKLVYVPS